MTSRKPSNSLPRKKVGGPGPGPCLYVIETRAFKTLLAALKGNATIFSTKTESINAFGQFGNCSIERQESKSTSFTLPVLVSLSHRLLGHGLDLKKSLFQMWSCGAYRAAAVGSNFSLAR